MGQTLGVLLGGWWDPHPFLQPPPGTGMGTASPSWPPSPSQCRAGLRSCPWMSFSPRSLPQFPPSQHAAERPDGLGGAQLGSAPSPAVSPPLPYPPGEHKGLGASAVAGSLRSWLPAGRLMAQLGNPTRPTELAGSGSPALLSLGEGGLGTPPSWGHGDGQASHTGGSERCPRRAVTRRNFARHHPRTSGPHCMSPLAWKRGAPQSTLHTKWSPKGSLQAPSRCWGLG